MTTFAGPGHRVRHAVAAAHHLRRRAVGVLVEAFVARRHRYLIQTVLAVAGLLAALVATVVVADAA